MTDPEAERSNRAMALMLAAVSWKGDPADVDSIMGLADEYLQYIQGDDNAAIPRPDKRTPGRLPKR